MDKNKDQKMEDRAGDDRSRTKKKGLLSFLSCCSDQDTSDDIGMQDAPQAARATSQTQSAKVPSKMAPSTSKNGTNDAEKQRKTDDAGFPVDTPTSPHNPSSSAPNGAVTTGQGAATGSDLVAGTSNTPGVVVSGPTPIADEDAVIADRTPEQQALDTDIEMTDVGPSVPLSTNDVPSTSDQSERSSSRVDIPPPPPLEERQAAVQHEVARQASPPGQNWLLPPVRPEHKGRKCLILDLDETLVHSSFKVCIERLLLDTEGYMLTFPDPAPS